MDKPTQRRHYHNHSTDVTLWMTDSIKEVLKKRNCEVVVLNVNAEIFVRMEKMQIINTVTCKYKEEGKLKCLEGYTNTNKIYDNKETKWLVNEIKDLECKALLKFGGSALETIEKKYSEPVVHEHIKDVVNKGVISKTFTVSEKVENIESFLTKEEFIRMWILNGKIEENQIHFDNVIIKNIHHTKENPSILMEFKWVDWNEFSKVELDLVEVGVNTQIKLKQTNVPISISDSVIAQWERRIFGTMGKVFNFTLKIE